MTPILVLRNVTKTFSGTPALQGCSFHAGKGEVTGLVGPNGSGKTTAFNIITGHLQPDGGEVLFKGKDITGSRPHLICAEGITRTFQESKVFDSLTLEENLRVAAIEKSVPVDPSYLLSELGLAEYEHEPAGELSFGQRKLLQLAMSRANDPELLLLDEPTAGVNPVLISGIRDWIRKQKTRITILVIEHNLKFVVDTCDRVVVLSEGAVLSEGTPDSIRNDSRVISAYLGKAPT